MQRTVLYQAHVNLGAKMTEFHDWEMPLYYTSILDEHRAVREAVGLFDISHMGQVIVEGPNAESSLNALLVSDIASVGTGRACYTLMLNERGGIIDDLIVYRIGPQRFLVIVNCSRRAVDVDWLQQHCTVRVSVSDVSATRGILALQGPRSAGLLDNALGSPVSILGRFDAKPLPGLGQDAWVARTGYTGSDGFEVFADNAVITLLWARLCPAVQGAGGAAVGLGARDTLRVEAGLRLYGSDMDETTTPYEAGLGWTVAMGVPQFIGQEVLRAQKENGLQRKFIGFTLEKGPVPRHGFPLFSGNQRVGEVTSGTFSPLLKQPLGMGYVAAAWANVGQALTMEVRNQRYPASVVKLPFWKAERLASAA